MIKENKAITLIALVITIIVLLILAGVAISMLSGENGILNQAAKAKTETEEESVRESIRLAELSARTLNEGSLTKEDLEKELKSYFGEGRFTVEETQDEDGTKTVYKVTVGEVEEIIEDAKSSTDVEVTIGEEKVTPENVAGYLGKKVTNYKGKTSVQIGDKTYTVSPDYRLYYIDFEGKYGDKGVIYLKAECTSNNEYLDLDTTSAESENIKIKALNPELYKGGNTGPATSNINMKAITWLTNTEHWKGLADESHKDDINYIVGAPSLEMMMDSYNTHYDLEKLGETPDTRQLDANTARVKLFYQYTQNDSGYKVGPCKDSSTTKEYHTYTSDYSVKTDGENGIDTVYYPGSNQYYWLASPSAAEPGWVMGLSSGSGGFVTDWSCDSDSAFCPLVSLKSSAQLNLEEVEN